MKVLHLHSCVVMFLKLVIIPARADRDMCFPACAGRRITDARKRDQLEKPVNAILDNQIVEHVQ